MEERKAKDLARAIGAWIDYQALCGRQDLLSEMYLGIPIGEFLISNSNWKIEPEFGHPQFKKSGRGRPRQTDYVILSRDTKRPICALEIKWIDKIANRQNIIDDVLRLECWRNEQNQGMNRFLIMASLGDFFQNFQDLDFNSNGARLNFFEQVFPSNEDEKKHLEIKNCESGLRRFFKDFSDVYRTVLPKSLKIKNISLLYSENPKRTVGIWRVESSSKRSTFKPDESWVKVF